MRWCRKRPVITALALGLLLAIAAGGSIATWQWMRAEQNLAEAKQEAIRAEDNLQQAEDTLMDLAWIVEESALWAPESTSFRDTVHAKLKEYQDQVIRQRDSTAVRTPLLAAIHSFAARGAALNNDFAGAHDNFQKSLDIWVAIVGEQPENQSNRRAMALCLFNYCRLLRDHARSEGHSDEMAPVRQLLHDVRNKNAVPAGLWFDYAKATLDNGNVFFNALKPREAIDTYDLGLTVTQDLVAEAPDNPEYQFLHGQCLRLIAVEKNRLKEGETAIGTMCQGREALQKAVRLSPQNALCRDELSEACRNLGDVSQRQEPSGGRRAVENVAAVEREAVAGTAIEPRPAIKAWRVISRARRC